MLHGASGLVSGSGGERQMLTIGRTLMGKAHLGFSGTLEELEAHPEMRFKYLEV